MFFDKKKNLTAVGFEPTPFQTGALNRRLRPLGHAIYIYFNSVIYLYCIFAYIHIYLYLYIHSCIFMHLL